MAYIVDNEVSDNFTVLDSTNNFVVGIDPSTFESQLYNSNGNDVVGSIPVTITELDHGSYRASFTPNIIGSWYLVIIHSIYFPTGKAASYWIETEITCNGGGSSSASTETNPLFKTVNFGEDSTGLTTVGYSLINYDGSINLARTTDNVFELKTNCGVYGVYLALDDPWNGLILWDDGQSEPTYASEQVSIDSTAFIAAIVEGIDADSYKLDAIYDKLPNNGIADAQDSTTIIDITTRIEDKTDIIDDKIDDLAQDATTIINTTNRIETKVDVVSDDLKRVLGLVHENIFIDLPTFDNANNLIGARLRIYSNPSSVGTNNDVLSTYAISSDTNDEPGKFTSWKQERI